MIVYLLALSSDSTAQALWRGRWGENYGDCKAGFSAIEDIDGNLVCGLADGDNHNLSFSSEIKACTQIDYNEKPPIIP